MGNVASQATDSVSIALDKEAILNDYRLAYQSRQASLLGRKEVLTGKAKFGIFGDGKEVAQIALSHFFQKGDFRSGYYRDQTMAFVLGFSNIKEFFAQLYADTDLEKEPASGGRQMNGHFATRSLNPDGSWKDLTEMVNCSSDISPTAAQMPRMVGLAYASKLYRELDSLKHLQQFSRQGNEIAWGTIGNASCAEGLFWEAVNACGVLQVPLVLSIWDDGYGISVPNEYQVTKNNISELLKGFQREEGTNGYEIFVARAWNYTELVATYEKAARVAREEHVPVIVHVTEVTQPQGHSTSGSHERYKSAERLQWEADWDGIKKMREWIIEEGMATEEELTAQEKKDKKQVRAWQKEAWAEFNAPIQEEIKKVAALITEVAQNSANSEEIMALLSGLQNAIDPVWRNIMVAVRRTLILSLHEASDARQQLVEWRNAVEAEKYEAYSSHVYSESVESASKVPVIEPEFSSQSETLNGFEIIREFFDQALDRDPRVIAFGEDLGDIGGVNQGMAGLQEKHGLMRVTDTGIRECTIIGQAIGMALRGLKPIAEIQYLDYILYAIQIMSDDLATLSWRTKGGQKAPVIVRTRGHRLEGIWHSGSLMAGVVNLVHGINVCVPRNFVQAAGIYNTLLHSDEPGIVVEVLNGYRLKEQRPDNLGTYTVPLGQPEVIREGTDLSIVTYGPSCRYAAEAAELLAGVGIEAEIIDVQTLLPFDKDHRIVESLKKTSRVIFLDEDVPGGITAYMLQKVIEEQKGYYWLDSEPVTLAAKPHRPAYGSDGDYWSKPQVEDIFDAAYALMNEVDPNQYPPLY